MTLTDAGFMAKQGDPTSMHQISQNHKTNLLARTSEWSVRLLPCVQLKLEMICFVLALR